MAIFNSYVKLPEGTVQNGGLFTWLVVQYGAITIWKK
jgi:hypothetical protein